MKAAKFFTIALLAGASFMTTVANAHDAEKGPCRKYVDQCKAENKGNRRAMMKCVSKAAHEANDTACTAKLKNAREKWNESRAEDTEKMKSKTADLKSSAKSKADSATSDVKSGVNSAAESVEKKTE